jgi:hypothetical protein
MYKNENTNSKVPDLVIDDEETPFVGSISTPKESHTSILKKKMMEVEELFEQQEEELNILAIKKQELNNNEEAVKFELSGLHGAKVVIQQLIEEAKDGQ